MVFFKKDANLDACNFLWAFKMEEAKVTTKELESIVILKDALLAIKSSTVEVVRIKK